MKFCQWSAVGILCLSAYAADTAKPEVVDSGSFGIMVNGRRIATESFKMEQREGSNLVSSQLKMEDAALKAVQTAEMELGADGALHKYLWKEISPGKAQIVVQPDDAFLVMKVSDGDSAAKDTMHPLAASTPILDDNFFSQVEVLMWRYLASSCHPTPQGGSECRYAEQKMPILNPHQQQSMVVTFNYVGTQKMRYKGADQEYRAFKFQTENGDWLVWMDVQNKLVRILIASESTEVLRD